ncbi:MAG: 50S ribosomal protein L13 [Elusimicrobia bacterium]|nr:50S ribosomal protein L13 [Elusimicrobiota bacterium]
MANRTTTFPDQQLVKNSRQWHHIDANDRILGRLASKAAVLLMGKHKVYWSPHIDCGDFVVVTNAKTVRVTGDKLIQKQYFRHSGYPAGGRTTPLGKLLQDRPERVIELAVKRMLPKNKLGHRMITRLKIYPTENHPHGTQHPTAIA